MWWRRYTETDRESNTVGGGFGAGRALHEPFPATGAPFAVLKMKKPCKSSTYKAFIFWWRFRDSNP